jgi:hypothetical protein
MIAPEELMSWLGRPVRLLPILALFVLATSCGNFFPSEGSIESVVVTPTAVLLEAGATTPDTYQLTSNATNVAGTQTNDTATAAWSTSTSTVATVGTSADTGTTPGLVTAVGSTANVYATITALDGGQSSSTTVYLYPSSAAPITTIVISTPNGTNIALGGTLTLAASYNTSTINIADYVSWSTSDPSIATVSNTGVVSLVGTPTATTFTVTATAYLGQAATSPLTSQPVTINIT